MLGEPPRSPGVFHCYLGILSIVVLCYIVIGSEDCSADVLIDEPLLIDDEVKWIDSRVVVSSPIRIAEGGELSIESCSVAFNGTYSLEVGITVEPYGRLEISGGSNGSELVKGTSDFAYFLRAYPDSTVLVSNTTVSEIGAPILKKSLWARGNCIRSDEVIFRNCTFTDCYIGIGLEGGGDSLIERSSFFNCSKGIVTFSASNLSIIDCDFTDGGDAIEAESSWQSIGMTLAVSSAEFRNCSRSITFKGYDLIVDECDTDGAKRDIYISGARRFSISDHYTSNSDVAFKFVGVDEGSIVGSQITNCTTGIIARGSHLSVISTVIDNASTAFEIEDSTIDIDNVAIHDSVFGVRIDDSDHIDDSGRSMRFEGALFDDVSFPFTLSEVSRVLVLDCVFTGHRPIITCTEIGELRFSDNEVNVDGLTFKLSGLHDGEVSMDAYSGVFLRFELDSTSMKYDCPDLDPTVVLFDLDGISRVMSYIHPDELNITFIDRLSEFIWIKDVSFNITKASDGSFAQGFEFILMDGSQSLLLDTRIGYSGVIRAGDVPLLSLGYQQSSARTPHTLEVGNNGTSHVFDFDLQSYQDFHLILNLIVDDVPPSIEFTSPSDGGQYPGPLVNISGEAIDVAGTVHSVQILLDGNETFNVSPDWSLMVQPRPGWHRLSGIATDNHENIGRVDLWFLVSDPTVSLEIIQPANGTITNMTGLTVEGRLVNGTWLTLNSGWVTLEPDGDFLFYYTLVEGNNHLQFEYQSGSSKKDQTISIILDTLKPDVDLDHLPKVTRDRTMTLSGKVIDNNPQSSLLVGDEEVTLEDDHSFSITIELSEGPNEIRIRIEDLAGNRWSHYTSIRLDSHIKYTLLEEPPQTTKQEFLTLKLICDEELEIMAYVNESTVGMYNFSSGNMDIVIDLKLGTNSIRVVVTDRAGNTATINATVVREQRVDGPSDPISPQIGLVVLVFILIFIPLAYIAWRGSTGTRES